MKYDMMYEASHTDGRGCINKHYSVSFRMVWAIVNYYLRDGFTIHHLTLKAV